MYGLAECQIFRKTSTLRLSSDRQSSAARSYSSGSPATGAMLKPAENARPAPVRITTRTSTSASIASKAAPSSVINSRLSALSLPGRLSVR